MEPRTIKKQELISLLAKHSGLTIDQSKRFLDSLEDVVRDKLFEGNSVTIPGIVKLNRVLRPKMPARILRYRGKEVLFPERPSIYLVKSIVTKKLKLAMAGFPCPEEEGNV